MANNFNPGFDREKAAFIELANKGEGLTPINYLYAKEGSFESILSPNITGGTAELYTIYANGINSANITNTEDIITSRLKWHNPFNDYYVGFTAPEKLTQNTIWRLPLADGKDKQVLATDGSGGLSFIDVVQGGGAPKDATFIIQTQNDNLPNAQVLEELGTGITKIVVGGAFAIAISGQDYATSEQLEEIRDQCQEYANSAKSSADSANNSADYARERAQEAENAADNARASAFAAESFSTDARASALSAAASSASASGFAGAAGASAAAAAISATAASASAALAADSAVEAKEYLDTLLSTELQLQGDITGSGLLNDSIITAFKPDPVFPGNGSMTMPSGNNTQRPVTLIPGMIRFNTSL